MAPSPQRRVILLGASNVVLALARIVAEARRLWPEPLEIMAAIGHGRSFGQSSAVLGRKISGISSCRLWEELTRRPTLPTAALVTDVGNDLLYGVPADRLLQWVDGCLQRLAQFDSQTIVGGIPVANIERLSSARFLLFRSLLFPRSPLTLETAKSNAADVDRQLAELASLRKCTVFPVKNEWYGFDPVHIRRSQRAAAWAEILSQWSGTTASDPRVRPSFWQAAYLRSLPPFERAWLGIRRQREQPSGVLPDGTTISLF